MKHVYYDDQMIAKIAQTKLTSIVNGEGGSSMFGPGGKSCRLRFTGAISGGGGPSASQTMNISDISLAGSLEL